MNKPNIKLAAKAEPLGAGEITVGNQTLCEIPSEAAQRKGFYSEQARELVALFPEKFKLIISKGQK